jgi:hypothetical protein
MIEHFCSLKVDVPQSVPPNVWTVVRFPYAGESSDSDDMHADTGTAWASDPASGLITPTDAGRIGHWWATAQWEAGNYTELRGQFCRDPYGVPDTTGTVHNPPSPGLQCFTYPHVFKTDPMRPVAFRVWHNASSARDLVLAEFKLAYTTDD